MLQRTRQTEPTHISIVQDWRDSAPTHAKSSLGPFLPNTQTPKPHLCCKVTEEIRKQGKKERGQNEAISGDRSSQESGRQRHQEECISLRGASLPGRRKAEKLKDSSYPVQLHSRISCPPHFLIENFKTLFHLQLFTEGVMKSLAQRGQGKGG